MDDAVKNGLQKIDAAMAVDDYSRAAEVAREIVGMPVEEIGTETFVRASVMAGFALIKLDHFDEAKNFLLPLLENEIAEIDAAYLLFSIAFAERSIEKIVYYGNRFLSLIPYPNEPPSCITTAVQNAHELINNLATTLMKEKRYDEAVSTLKKGLEFKSDYPLLYINLGIGYHIQEKFGEAETVLFEGVEKCTDTAEIKRTLGLIYAENHFYVKAELNFAQAREEGSIETLLDLGMLYQKLVKIYDAEEALLEYLKHFPEHSDALKLLSDIRSLDFYAKPEPKISAAMIVKDEESMLAECIESFREAVDEIVIVDTGSTDRTVDIAKEYRVKLYHYKWKDDFSAARNYSISKATGDWVMIIDADERIAREDIPKIRSAKWQEEYDAVCFTVFSSLPGQLGDANFGKHYSPRLFKNRPDIYYYGIVHNLLNVPDKIAVSEIKNYHLGYDLDKEKMQKKFERSITLLLKQLEEHPDDAFVLMNTAQMFLSRNHSEEAERYAKECVRLLEEDPKDQEHLLLMGLYQLSLVYLRRQDFKECEKYCMKALDRKENYIDPMLNLGICYFQSQDYDKAMEFLEKFMAFREELIRKEEFNLLILNKLGSDYEANYLIGEIHRIRNEYDLAKERLTKALRSNNLFWNIHNSLGKIYLDEHNYTAAAEAFENAVKYGYLNAERYGTLGSSPQEYKSAIENYKLALEKDLAAEKSKPTVKDALGKIDALLGIRKTNAEKIE